MFYTGCESKHPIGRVGVIAHELGHFLGLPDYYDYENPGEGTGSYDLMANSWGFDFSQNCIPHMSAYNKIVLGWINANEIEHGEEGRYVLRRVEEYSTKVKAFKIDHNMNPGEYFLIENRQPYGTEYCIPTGGLIVMHIDENVADNNIIHDDPA